MIMDGQFLNSKYLSWLHLFINGSESFVSDDIDYFFLGIKRDGWTLSGLAILALTEVFCSTHEDVSAELLINLRTTKNKGRIPNHLSRQLLNGVYQPPTLVLERGLFYYHGLRDSGYIIRELNSSKLGFPEEWASFYFERRENDPESSFDRFIELIPKKLII